MSGWYEWKQKGGKCDRCIHDREDHNDFNCACTKCGCGWYYNPTEQHLGMTYDSPQTTVEKERQP